MPRCSGRSPPTWASPASTRWTAPMAAPGQGPTGGVAGRASAWRSHGDTVERLEVLARMLVAVAARLRPEWTRPAPLSSRSSAACARRCWRAARRRSGCCAALDGRASSSRARAARRPAAGPTCCRPGATSSRSTARRADPGGLAPGLEIGGAAGRALRPGARRVAARVGAVGLGHRQHAHGRRRHRPGAGADRRAPDVGRDLAPGHRDRDPAARPARPPAGRRHPAGLRLLPRRLPSADRAVRSRRAGGRRASTSRGHNPIAARVRADSRRCWRRARSDLARRRAELSRVRLKPGAYGAGCRR